jgi:hypothetical protein
LQGWRPYRAPLRGTDHQELQDSPWSTPSLRATSDSLSLWIVWPSSPWSMILPRSG